MALGVLLIRGLLLLLSNRTTKDTEFRHVGIANYYVDFEFGFVNPVYAAEEYAKLYAYAADAATGAVEGGPSIPGDVCGFIPPPGNCSRYDEPLNDSKDVEPSVVQEHSPEDCDEPVRLNMTCTNALSYVLNLDVLMEQTEAVPLAKRTDLFRRLQGSLVLTLMLVCCCSIIGCITPDFREMTVTKMQNGTEKQTNKERLFALLKNELDVFLRVQDRELEAMQADLDKSMVELMRWKRRVWKLENTRGRK